MSIEVLAPGLLTTVQDGGRFGHAAIGVGTAGAMDAVALRLANALVGNAADAAGLECTLRGPRLRFAHDVLIALTGAAADARCGDRAVPAWRPVALRAGSELAIGTIRRGARAYLAVGGGIGGARVLGSRSRDLNAELGGAALRAGEVLPIGTDDGALSPAARASLLGRWLRQARDGVAAAPWSIDPGPWFDADPARPLRAVVGTHFAHLDAASRRALFDAAFRIGADSNRVGLRLEGTRLALEEPLELVSEGVVPGTVQLPPSGDPIVLMAEAPTVGGYPRIAHVIEVDRPRLAQRRPGERVRFVEVSLGEAQTRYLERERALAALDRTIRERLQ
jgi:antagonist of KipI